MPQNPNLPGTVPDCTSISVTEFGSAKIIAYQYKNKATDENSENVNIDYTTLTAPQKAIYDTFVSMIDSFNV